MTPEEQERERRRKQARQLATAGIGAMRGDVFTEPEERFDDFALDGDAQWSPDGTPEAPTYNDPPSYGNTGPQVTQLGEFTIEAPEEARTPEPASGAPSAEMRRLIETDDDGNELIPQEAGDPPPMLSERGNVTRESIMADRPGVVAQEYAPGESQAEFPYPRPEGMPPYVAPTGPPAEMSQIPEELPPEPASSPELQEAIQHYSAEAQPETDPMRAFQELGDRLSAPRAGVEDVDPAPRVLQDEAPTGSSRLADALRRDRMLNNIRALISSGATLVSTATNDGDFARPVFAPSTFGDDMKAVLAQEGREAEFSRTGERQGQQDELAQRRLTNQEQQQQFNQEQALGQAALRQGADARAGELHGTRMDEAGAEAAERDPQSDISARARDMVHQIMMERGVGETQERDGSTMENAALTARLEGMSYHEIRNDELLSRYLSDAGQLNLENLRSSNRLRALRNGRGPAGRGGGGGGGGGARAPLGSGSIPADITGQQIRPLMRLMPGLAEATDEELDARWAMMSRAQQSELVDRTTAVPSANSSASNERAEERFEATADHRVNQEIERYTRRVEGLRHWVSSARNAAGVAQNLTDGDLSTILRSMFANDQVSTAALSPELETAKGVIWTFWVAERRRIAGAAITETEEAPLGTAYNLHPTSSPSAFRARFRQLDSIARETTNNIRRSISDSARAEYIRRNNRD